MDGLPLALVAAGSYMSNINIDCRKYLKLHEENWHTLQQHTPPVPSYNGNLCSCWAITFHELLKSLDVLHVLVCWACLESQDVWFELLDPNGLIWPGILVMKFDSAMRLLFDYGIVEFGSHVGDDSIGSRGYNMQRSFHAWLQTRIHNLMHDPSIESLALSAVIHCSQKLIKSGIYHKGLLRVLPHASRCADLAMTERIHTDINNMIHLATVFQYAGYGKSRKFSLYLAMLQLEDPARVHFMTSEMLLQHALRKIEQTSTLGTIPEAAGRIPHQRFLYHYKVAALRGLRIVYRHMSEFSRRQMITSQIYAVHRDADNEPEAQLEQANMSNEFSHAKHLRILRRLTFTHVPLTILTTVLCIIFLGDGMDLLQLIAAGYTFLGSWLTFMYSRRYRRKAFVVLILSSVPLGYLFRNLGLGPFMLLWTEYPFVLMVLSTFPVLYYQGLSTVAH